MAALYGRVHGLGPRQQTRKAMNKETDAGAVHMETIRATITERPGLGGGWWQRRRWGGATKALVVAMATMHTARLKRGEKQEMSDTPEVPARSVSAACPSTKPLQLPAAMNCANVLMGCQWRLTHSEPQQRLTEATGCCCSQSPRRNERNRALGCGHEAIETDVGRDTTCDG